MMENIYDYLMRSSLASIRTDARKHSNWHGWRDFPRNQTDFCNFFGLADDQRIRYDTIVRGSYVECYAYITLDLGDMFDNNPVYSVKWTVSGSIGAFTGLFFGGTSREFSYKFKKVYIPGEDHVWNNELGILIDHTTLVDNFKHDKNTTIGEVIGMITNKINEMYPYIQMVINSYVDGSFATYMNKHSTIGVTKSNYESYGMTTINCMTLISTLYLAHSVYGIELSMDDLVALLCYYVSQHGVGPFMNSIQNADERVAFIHDWSFWHHSGYENALKNIPSKEEFEKLIKISHSSAQEQCGKNEEFVKVMIEANEELYTMLEKTISSVSERFGINQKYLWCNNELDRFHIETFISRYKKENAPVDWRLR